MLHNFKAVSFQLTFVDNLRKTCYLNLATCQAKHNMHQAVIDNCSKVLIDLYKVNTVFIAICYHNITVMI